MKFIPKIYFYTMLFLLIFYKNSLAQIDVGNVDLSREIEKSMLFDRETLEKFDVYNDEYGSNKLSEPSLGSLPTQDEKKEYTPEEMNIILVDKVKVDKDMREKEKLAYNSVVVGQYEIALELYKEILKKEPKNNYAKFSMAVVYQRLNQFKLAKNLYYDLLKDSPENKEEIISNIIAIMVEETPREALYLLDRLTKQNPSASFLLANMAMANEKIGNFDEAISNYQKALNIEPNNFNYSYNLAVLYDQKRDFEKAIEMYNLAIKNGNGSEISYDLVRKRIDKLKLLI
jgi:tetratricopeptide (TPR) repeat protein